MHSRPQAALRWTGCLALLLLGCHGSAPVKTPVVTTVSASSPNQFTDVAARAGLHFTHENGAFGKKWLPETMGSGVAFIDYDGDGYQDLFVVNGRGWNAQELKLGKAVGQSKRPTNTTCHLYHNNRNGTFTDVTRGSGLDVPMYGMGVCVGDFDNDGKPDLFVTGLGRVYLFHNLGGGKFKEISRQAGIVVPGWSSGAAWVDYDRDGKLDLFVCRYVRWTPDTDIFHALDGVHKSYARPDVYTGEYNYLFHNDGNGHFTDVSERAHIKAPDLQSKSLGVTICDFDGDGWPDIAVTNDTQPNYLFRNNHDGTFTETARSAGVAFGESGTARGAMGIDVADYDHSGRDSLVIGNFAFEMLSLYQNTNGSLFIDAAAASGVGPPTRRSLSFGVTFLDYDNDSWQDILIANGHVDDDIGKVSQEISYAERPLLFHNLGGAHFQNVTDTSGPALKPPMVARGMACGDFDLDGSVDVAISTNGGPLHLWQNTGGSNNAIRLELEGTKSNRSAIGARVTVTTGVEKSTLMVRSGGSYLSQSELPLTCGIGKNTTADIHIAWPSGGTTELLHLAAGKFYHVVEGKGISAARDLKRV